MNKQREQPPTPALPFVCSQLMPGLADAPLALLQHAQRTWNSGNLTWRALLGGVFPIWYLSVSVPPTSDPYASSLGQRGGECVRVMCRIDSSNVGH